MPFLLAWHWNRQLREPEAFGGWLRRLVATQCHRRLRGRRLTVPLETEAPLPAANADPEARAGAAAEAQAIDHAQSHLRARARSASERR